MSRVAFCYKLRPLALSRCPDSSQPRPSPVHLLWHSGAWWVLLTWEPGYCQQLTVDCGSIMLSGGASWATVTSAVCVWGPCVFWEQLLFRPSTCLFLTLCELLDTLGFSNLERAVSEIPVFLFLFSFIFGSLFELFQFCFVVDLSALVLPLVVHSPHSLKETLLVPAAAS